MKMKLYFCVTVLCAFIAQISARVTEKNDTSIELPKYYTDLVERSKESSQAKDKLDEYECMRGEMDLSIEQMYNVFIRGTFKFQNGKNKSLDCLPQALKWGCPKLHPVAECLRKSLESQLQSIDSNKDDHHNERLEEIVKSIPIIENLLKYFCENNDGELIVQFATYQAGCDIFDDSAFSNCKRKFHMDQLSKYPTPNLCSGYLEAQTCASTVLKERCQSQIVAETFLIGTTELYKQLKC